MKSFSRAASIELSGRKGVSSIGAGAWALPNRKYPVNFGFSLSVKSRQTLVLPPGYYVKSLPDTYDLSTKEVAIRSSRTVSSGRIEGSGIFAITMPQIPVEDYLANRTLMQKMEDVAKQQVILAR